jgi:hypothetical protein
VAVQGLSVQLLGTVIADIWAKMQKNIIRDRQLQEGSGGIIVEKRQHVQSGFKPKKIQV